MSTQYSSMMPDTQARQQALDIHTSFVVQAPAGSGKTELLISRLLALFADAATTAPEQVLAITFTRKAAAEMVTRLLTALRAANKATDFEDWLLITNHNDQDRADKLKANSDAVTLKQHQYAWAKQVLQKDWSLLSNPHRLRITTIDGFCNALARQTPLLGQLAPGLGVADDAFDLYDKAARQTLGALESTDDSQLRSAIETLLPVFGNNLDALRGLLANQLANRDQWTATLNELDTDTMSATLTRLFEPQFNGLLSRLIPELPLLANLAGQCLQGLLAYNQEKGKTLDNELAHNLTALNDDVSFWQEASLNEQLTLVKAIKWLVLTGSDDWRQKAGLKVNVIGLDSKKDAEKTQLLQLIERLQAVDGFAEQLLSVSALPAPDYSPEDEQRITALKTLFSAAATQLLMVFGEQRQTDHTQFTQAALIALNPNSAHGVSDVLLKLDAQLRHILIDEFQDTSVTQWELLKYLIAGWQPVGNGNEKEGRTLFLVGDPMQSIYRFRKAEPALFTTAKTQGIPLDNGQHLRLMPLQLSSNFRSLPAMIDFANRAFHVIFPTEAQAQEDASLGACRYSPAQATKTGDAYIALWLETHGDKLASGWFDADLTNEKPSLDPNLAVADMDTAQRIRAWLQTQTLEKPASVAILVRSKKHLLPILSELEAHDIPVHAEEIATLTERWYIQDLLALTRLITDPSDRVALLSVLRAPWCGLSLTALHAIAQQPDPLWQGLLDVPLAPDDQQRLVALVNALSPLMAQRGHQPLATQVRAASLALGLPSLLSDDSARADVVVYWDKLRQLDKQHPHLDLPTLNDALDKLFAKPAHPHASVVAMTIHKSKGLEFDTVILPSLDKKGANDTAGLLTWQKLAEGDDLHDIIAPLDKDKSPLFIWLQSLEKKKADYELDRLLYVALTRAVKHLIVIATLNPSKDKAGWKLPVANNSLMGCLWRVPAIQASTQSLLASLSPPDDTDEITETEAVTPLVIPSLLRFSQTQLLQAQQTLSAMPQYLVQSAQPSLTALVDTNSTGEQDSDASDGIAAQIGTVTHALLERIANDGLAQWTSTHLQQQTPWLGYQLRSLGVPVSKQDAAITTIMQAINNTLTDDKGRWILHHWQQARNEWTLMDVDARTGKLQRHILDRSFIDEQGVRWIIDYKTSQLADGDLFSFVQQKRQLYQPQLARYAHLVRQLDSEHPIQTALFFPLLPVAERWQLVHSLGMA